jgi:hypothetical protein
VRRVEPRGLERTAEPAVVRCLAQRFARVRVAEHDVVVALPPRALVEPLELNADLRPWRVRHPEGRVRHPEEPAIDAPEDSHEPITREGEHVAILRRDQRDAQGKEETA